MEPWLVSTVTSRTHCISGGTAVKIKLGQRFLNTLRHLSDNILLFGGNHTGRVGKGKVQDNINEAHDKIAVVAADVYNNTAEYSEKDGDLGDGIEFLNRRGKIMFWVVLSVVGFWEVNNDSPFECSTGPDLSSGEGGNRVSSSISRFSM